MSKLIKDKQNSVDLGRRKRAFAKQESENKGGCHELDLTYKNKIASQVLSSFLVDQHGATLKFLVRAGLALQVRWPYKALFVTDSVLFVDSSDLRDLRSPSKVVTAQQIDLTVLRICGCCSFEQLDGVLNASKRGFILTSLKSRMSAISLTQLINKIGKQSSGIILTITRNATYNRTTRLCLEFGC